MSDTTEILTLDQSRALIRTALIASGTSPLIAQSVAAALVAAEAEGQVGHGFSRLSDYAAQVKSGKVNGTAEPRLITHKPSQFTVDAGSGFAYPALDLAISTLIEAAHNNGTASASVIQSHHCGALSLQVEKIAQAGMIGMMMANTPSAIAPWGASTPVFGTNPIAFAAPRRDAPPLVIDLSLSTVARGKVMHAKKSGQDIPLGWALDHGGAPTTDPEAALAGSMVPIGAAKGSALALIVEILAATLGGAHHSTEMSSFFEANGPAPNAGQFLMAFAPADTNGFADRLERLLSLITDLEGARLPGTRRETARVAAEKTGLKVPKHYIDTARALARSTA